MGAYCDKAKEFTCYTENGVCSGVLKVRSSGTLLKDNNIEKYYEKSCPHSVPEMTMRTVKSEISLILDCHAVKKQTIYYSEAPKPPTDENVE